MLAGELMRNAKGVVCAGLQISGFLYCCALRLRVQQSVSMTTNRCHVYLLSGGPMTVSATDILGFFLLYFSSVKICFSG